MSIIFWTPIICTDTKNTQKAIKKLLNINKGIILRLRLQFWMSIFKMSLLKIQFYSQKKNINIALNMKTCLLYIFVLWRQYFMLLKNILLLLCNYDLRLFFIVTLRTTLHRDSVQRQSVWRRYGEADRRRSHRLLRGMLKCLLLTQRWCNTAIAKSD